MSRLQSELCRRKHPKAQDKEKNAFVSGFAERPPLLPLGQSLASWAFLEGQSSLESESVSVLSGVKVVMTIFENEAEVIVDTNGRSNCVL